MNKYYSYDIGIRNSLISNFNKFKNRNDIGQFWENFVLTERIKFNEYNEIDTNYYFWRTYEQQEIDLIEENNGKLYGYEFKWAKNNSKSLKLWLETYKEASYKEINKENYFEFIL